MTEKSTKKFLEIIGAADAIKSVAEGLDDTQRVLMSGDIVLLDTKSTDYNGRICHIRRKTERTGHFERVFIDKDTVTAVCATDGDVYFTAKLDEVEIEGVAVGIVRKLEPEERKDDSAWEAFCREVMHENDTLRNYYPINWDYFNAVRQHERGGAYGMLMYGYSYGFERGRKAQKAEGRRKRRAEKKKEAVHHE